MQLSNTIRDKRPSTQWIAYFAIMYYALSFPNAIELMIGSLLAVLFIIIEQNGKVRINSSFLWVFLFVLTFFLLESYLKYSLYKRVAYSFNMILLFLLGYNLYNSKDNNIKQQSIAKNAIDIMFYGIAFYIIVCIIYTLIRGFRFDSNYREPIIFWNNQVGSSTHFGSISTLPMALGIYKLFMCSGKEQLRALFITVSIIVVNLLLSNRASLLFLGAFLLIAVLFKYSGKRLDKAFAAYIVLAVLMIFSYFLYEFNFFGVRDLVYNIPVFQRIQLLEQIGYKDPRIERQLYVIKHFKESVFGGGYFSNLIGDPHNVWLDIYDYSGIIPFIFFSIISFTAIFRVILGIQKYSADKIFGMLSMIIIGFMIAFVEEPVFRSVESYTILFFFSLGLLFRWADDRKRLYT